MDNRRDYEFAPIDLQFKCSHSIYTKGGSSSICYATSEERAKFIVAALNHFESSGKAKEFLTPSNSTG